MSIDPTTITKVWDKLSEVISLYYRINGEVEYLSRIYTSDYLDHHKPSAASVELSKSVLEIFTPFGECWAYRQLKKGDLTREEKKEYFKMLDDETERLLSHRETHPYFKGQDDELNLSKKQLERFAKGDKIILGKHEAPRPY